MAKKRIKHKITLKEAIDRIPHDWAYCLDSGRCPFWQVRKCHSKGQMLRKAKEAQIFGLPIGHERQHVLEYCAFLGQYLSIQDGCKDCGINEDDPDGNYGDMDLPKRARIKNREYADFYKEKFPEEADLIDKIVEEDKLEYWYKDKEDEDESSR